MKHNKLKTNIFPTMRTVYANGIYLPILYESIQ